MEKVCLTGACARAHSKRATIILFVATLTMALLPAIPVQAIDTPLLDTYTGNYGDTIIVTGSGATEDMEVNVYWDAVKAWDGEKGLLNSTESKAGGFYEIWLDVPEAIAGDHYIWVRDTYSGDTAVSSAFTVVPWIKLSPYIGLPGDEIAINGYGFGEQVDIVGVFWDYDLTPLMLTTTPSSPETNSVGSWEASFNVPSWYDYGFYLVYAEDASGFSDTATFKLGAVISFDVDEGPVGTVVEVSGRGFTPANKIWQGDVWLVDGATTIDCFMIHEPIVVDAYGDVKFEIVIPLVSDDDEKYVITVIDGVESATEKFHVIGLAKIKVDPDFGLPGSLINIEGWNLAQIPGEDVMIELWNETLNIKIYEISVYETDSSGYFSGTFHTPPLSAGKYALVAFKFDYNIFAQAMFKVCALGPSIIESSDHEGYRKDEFNWDEGVYVFGSGYTPTMTYDLYIVEDVATWTDGMPLPSPVVQTTVTADGDGNIPVTKVWIAKLEVGEYDIVVDVNDNGEYNEDVDALDDLDVNSAGFFIIPELPSGTILGLATCIATLGLYRFTRKNIRL